VWLARSRPADPVSQAGLRVRGEAAARVPCVSATATLPEQCCLLMRFGRRTAGGAGRSRCRFGITSRLCTGHI
jgi:hypothetical protein